MIRTLLLLIAVTVGAGCMEGRSPVSATGDPSADQAPSAEPRAAANQTADSDATEAQRAYVDPDSGELIPRPADATQDETSALRTAPLSTPTNTLDERPSPVPGGGVVIDLPGRFLSPMSATTDGQPTDAAAPPANSPAMEATDETP